MGEANLTRFGPARYECGQDGSKRDVTTFRAIDGPARLVLRADDIDRAWIRVNGHEVIRTPEIPGNGDVERSLDSARRNTIEVTAAGRPGGTLEVRVTQRTRADLGLVRQGYFGLNTSNLDRQRAFYRTLGFIGEIFPAGPETSTSFARSLGFADDYLIHVSLHSLADPPVMPFVDTVQFRGDSFRDEPPYARLNHIGMAYATYSATDLDAAWGYLRSRGVDFVSAPATAPDGERFVFLKDQDGTFLKLVQATEEHVAMPGAGLVRLVNTNMNVSDLERSREFYRLLGFAGSGATSQAGAGEFAAAHGFDRAIEFEGEDVRLAGGDGATIQLRRWKAPYDDAPPYPPPVNHLGIDRINFYVKDLSATIETMNALGFRQLGPIGGSPELGIVFFFDPDGIKVQFAGPSTG